MGIDNINTFTDDSNDELTPTEFEDGKELDEEQERRAAARADSEQGRAAFIDTADRPDGVYTRGDITHYPNED